MRRPEWHPRVKGKKEKRPLYAIRSSGVHSCDGIVTPEERTNISYSSFRERAKGTPTQRNATRGSLEAY